MRCQLQEMEGRNVDGGLWEWESGSGRLGWAGRSSVVSGQSGQAGATQRPGVDDNAKWAER